MKVTIKDGRIIRDYKRQQTKFADYVLYNDSSMFKNPIAVVKVKKIQFCRGIERE
jgi:type I site-specific restriction endonuclease